MKVLGVDPGLTGALALFDEQKTRASGLRWQLIDTQTKKDLPELNAAELMTWVQQFSPDVAVIERARAMPSFGKGDRRAMGSTGAFRYGGIYHSVIAVLECCGVKVVRVEPASWKKYYGLKGSDKEQSRLAALRLFPEAGTFLARKMDQNRAEAMLIASYGFHRATD